MGYIILSRNPRTNKLVIVTDDEDNVPAEFEIEEQAVQAAHYTTVCKAWGYQIVQVE